MCIIVSNEPKYCACLYVNNVLYVYNCIHQKAIKPSCILYLGFPGAARIVHKCRFYGEVIYCLVK